MHYPTHPPPTHLPFPNNTVLIVDDFLATGTTAIALMDIVRQADATLVGLAFLIEKEMEKGAELITTALADARHSSKELSRALNMNMVGEKGQRSGIVCLANVAAMEDQQGGKIRVTPGSTMVTK